MPSPGWPEFCGQVWKSIAAARVSAAVPPVSDPVVCCWDPEAQNETTSNHGVPPELGPPIGPNPGLPPTIWPLAGAGAERQQQHKIAAIERVFMCCHGGYREM